MPADWIGNVAKEVLALASGGGQQKPVFAAPDADIMVLDMTPAQLEKDHAVAKRENIRINLVQADMTENFLLRMVFSVSHSILLRMFMSST